MSIRTRSFALIILIAVIIIIFGIGSGLMFVQGHLEQSIESDMTEIAEIADMLLTTEINLLKSDATVVARNLVHLPDDELYDALEAQAMAYDNFTSLTIFDRTGIVTSWGASPTSEEFLADEYLQRAFAGEAVISSTRYDASGDIVFHLCIPLGDGDRALSVTIPGMLFSDLISSIQIWETGNIFILDMEGTILANIRENWVTERFNFVKSEGANGQDTRLSETVKRMIRGEIGIGRFSVEGKERLCVFMPITGSKVGWSLGVVAPLGESPLQNVRNGLVLVGVVCLVLSVISAFFASISLEKPYKLNDNLVAALEAQGKLLYAINDTAVMLLDAEAGDFESSIVSGMEMMALCAKVDRMRIWKNSVRDGELYCSQIYEWSGGAEPQSGKAITIDVAYSKNIPGWEEKLSAGQIINTCVSHYSQEEKAQLLPQQILSILVIPVFFQNCFWGFVCFDDCHGERVFTIDDENLLRSGGLLIANALLRAEMTLDLVKARESAVASASAKSDFLANMSHEMRTPLNAIIGLSELTLDIDDIREDVRDNIGKMYNSGVTLLSLINDILDISKIESGKFELIPVEYDTPSLINDTVTLNIVRIGSKPITFHLDIDESMPSQLVGDELRIKQVFNNLLSNAFKYTKEGSVVWHITFEMDGDAIWLVSRVTDSGIGIHLEDVKKLFSEYNQVDTKSNRKIEGTGLGLSICKSMAEMMGGGITVESEYGNGSTFTVRLRQGRAQNSVPIGAEVAENLRNFHYSDNRRDRSAKLLRTNIPYARVLIVDDISTNLDVARGMMKPYGMQIDCVTSGPAAIDLIRKQPVTYNAIFMDHMMPGMDGIEATRIIREEIGTEYAKNIPIIALTANAIVGNEDMFLSKGFQAFLSKPIDIMRMDVVINYWVRDKELEKELAKDTHHNQQSMTSPRTDNEKRSANDENSDFDLRDYMHSGKFSVRGLDLKKGLKRFGDDEETYLGVLKSYVQNTPPLLDKLRECTQESLPDYAIVVHGIKSSSRSIGAEPIGAQAEALEFASKAGDLTFVKANNNDFTEAVQALIDGSSKALEAIARENPKPRKTKPDADTLATLSEACKSFDIDEVDKAMKELESYEYESNSDLVEWLRSQVNVMGLKKIVEKLSEG
ncbi:ATP-binding protein [Lachnospiraceae bacterium ZAX-1]